jgi:hypothetical protein
MAGTNCKWQSPTKYIEADVFADYLSLFKERTNNENNPVFLAPIAHYSLTRIIDTISETNRNLHHFPVPAQQNFSPWTAFYGSIYDLLLSGQ